MADQIVLAVVSKVPYIAAMAAQPTHKPRGISIQFDENGAIRGDVFYVYIMNTVHHFYVRHDDAPEYVHERIALMKLTRDVPCTDSDYYFGSSAGIREALKNGIGIWISEHHLLLALSVTEYEQLKQFQIYGHTRKQSKKRSKAKARLVQGVLPFSDDGGIR